MDATPQKITATIKVSIITPCFNRGDIISETAQSIFQQTYTNWEWVIVDDGSSDNSLEIIRAFADQDNRVKVLTRDRFPKGACTCRNIAVENSEGDYLLFLDTDDLLSSFCLSQRVKAVLEAPECDFIIFPMLLFKKNPDDLNLLWNIDNHNDDIDRVLSGDPICQGTGTLWKKKSFINVGMWDEQLYLWQDIELHLRSFLKRLKYEKRFDLQPDVFLRISDVSLSRTGYHSLPKFLSRWRVFKQTAEEMQMQSLILTYQKGLKRMFTDIFINAVSSRYHSEANEMIAYVKKSDLFNKHELRTLKLYHTVNKFKLYKIPVFIKYIQSLVQKNLEYKNAGVGKHIYITKTN